MKRTQSWSSVFPNIETTVPSTRRYVHAIRTIVPLTNHGILSTDVQLSSAPLNVMISWTFLFYYSIYICCLWQSLNEKQKIAMIIYYKYFIVSVGKLYMRVNGKVLKLFYMGCLMTQQPCYRLHPLRTKETVRWRFKPIREPVLL